MLTYLWGGLAVGGLALGLWARYSLPDWTTMLPVPIVQHTCRGPYRYLRHPMYVGNIALFIGLGGLAAGMWNALALGLLSEIIMREWAYREDGRDWTKHYDTDR